MIAERLVCLALRFLRVPCGDYGGQWPDRSTRWCLKRFGHRDSHAYDFTEQPLRGARLRAQGWNDVEVPRG
jgi:hypothetical protein